MPVRCYTPCQFAAIPRVSSLLYPMSVRCYTPWCEVIALSRSLAERGQPARPCYLPPSDGAAGRSLGVSTPNHPLPQRLPPPGVDGIPRQQYTTLPAGSDPSLSSAAPSWARVFEMG